MRLVITNRKKFPLVGYLAVIKGFHQLQAKRLGDFVIDTTASGELAGIELLYPPTASVEAINTILSSYGAQELTAEEIALLRSTAK